MFGLDNTPLDSYWFKSVIVNSISLMSGEHMTEVRLMGLYICMYVCMWMNITLMQHPAIILNTTQMEVTQ